MFSANPSISSTRLKPLDVANGKGNEVGRGGTGSDWGIGLGGSNRGRIRLGVGLGVKLGVG